MNFIKYIITKLNNTFMETTGTLNSNDLCTRCNAVNKIICKCCDTDLSNCYCSCEICGNSVLQTNECESKCQCPKCKRQEQPLIMCCSEYANSIGLSLEGDSRCPMCDEYRYNCDCICKMCNQSDHSVFLICEQCNYVVQQLNH